MQPTPTPPTQKPAPRKPERRSVAPPKNASPHGIDPHHRPYSWKILPHQKRKAKADIEAGLDEEEVERRKVSAVSRFGSRERWIVFFTLALIPALLAYFFVGDSVQAAPEAMVTIHATMIADASG